jgi:hypothetical protein
MDARMVAAEDISDLVRENFVTLPAVSDVEVDRRPAAYTVEISVTDFGEQVRHQIYNKQRELMERFPDVFFRFHILDESPKHALASDANDPQ